MKISVVIPAYNEEKNIAKTVKAIYSYLKEKHPNHEILVVVDGAKDQTAQAAGSVKGEVPTLQILDIKENRGKGAVVRDGMLKATGDIRLFTDADNSTSIDHLERMLPWIAKGYDVVIASIAVKGATVASGSEPFWRRLFGKMGNLYIQILAVPGVRDTQRGFKVFTAKAAEKIFPNQTITRWGFDVEVLALARKFKFKIKEVPIDWRNDPNSHVGLSAYFQVLKETAQVRWNLLTGKYKK